MLCVSFLPTASLFLLLLPCFPSQDGGAKEQSADVISAWKGDSISITCSMNDSENQVGVYLKDIRQNVQKIYFTKDEAPNIHPAMANRTKCSKEGRNLRITLHSVQESDSSVYLCYEIVKISGHHKELCGKKTIVVVKAKTSGALEQSPPYANPEQGQSVSITCVLKSSAEDEGIYLLRTHVQPGQVLYVSNPSVSKVFDPFVNRLEYSREGKRIVITLHNLRENDTDNYVCAEDVKNSSLLSASGTMVLVKGAEQAHSQVCEKSSWDVYALIIVVVLLFCALMCCTLYRGDMKKYFQKKKSSVVYEDMSYNSRRNTLVRTNTYSKGN